MTLSRCSCGSRSLAPLQSIQRSVPLGHTFKGYPQHFTHTDPELIFEEMLRAAVRAPRGSRDQRVGAA